MKIFIDSGNIKEIEGLMPLGIIDGITTNPSLLAKEPAARPRSQPADCSLPGCRSSARAPALSSAP